MVRILFLLSRARAGRVGTLEVLGEEVQQEGGHGHRLGGRRESGRIDRLVSHCAMLLQCST